MCPKSLGRRRRPDPSRQGNLFKWQRMMPGEQDDEPVIEVGPFKPRPRRLSTVQKRRILEDL